LWRGEKGYGRGKLPGGEGQGIQRVDETRYGGYAEMEVDIEDRRGCRGGAVENERGYCG
jgi:hypothetical protein